MILTLSCNTANYAIDVTKLKWTQEEIYCSLQSGADVAFEAMNAIISDRRRERNLSTELLKNLELDLLPSKIFKDELVCATCNHFKCVCQESPRFKT